MAVSTDRMVEIFDRVKDLLEDANENGSLHDMLSLLGLQGLIDGDEEIDLGAADNAYGDILVLGHCDAKKHHLQAVAYECGYDRNRVKFVDYDEMQQFDCASLCYSMRYSAIMCGPVPHKAGDMGDTSSILEELRHPERGYPPLAELRESGGTGELRITKTTFRSAIGQLESLGAIKPNK